jgi:endonuclease-8
VPEGDTIFKIARTLDAVLRGQRILRVRSPLVRIEAAELAGRTVASVEARGKNVLVHFDDGRALLTHLKMHGSWHVYRSGERWRGPQRQLRVALEVPGFSAVCFSAPACEVLSPLQQRDHPALHLGPDASADRFHPQLAAARLRALGDLPIGVALVRQDALAGLGNVFKSELLFELQQDPFAPVSALSDARLSEIVEHSRKMLLANRHTTERVTRRSLAGRGTHWVYRREGEPCRRCGHLIRMERQGELRRSTYFCPRCQGP